METSDIIFLSVAGLFISACVLLLVHTLVVHAHNKRLRRNRWVTSEHIVNGRFFILAKRVRSSKHKVLHSVTVAALEQDPNLTQTRLSDMRREAEDQMWDLNEPWKYLIEYGI